MVLSVLFLSLVLVLLPGTLALLYHLNFLVHIILFVVVLLPMDPIVGHFLLVRTVRFLGPAGALALLYNVTSYYPLRGGYSDSSVYCGEFYVNEYFSFSRTTWGFGAAL